ncbi:FeoB small GTPase domain-containing protein [Streptomyces flaveolus]|uniref:FeoB small GTPase domain-containing protein n=1 Tax=Streptomyces flaveolus TaxID=67297 RepID=UPI003F5415EF
MSAGCHDSGHGHAAATQAPRIALVGSPNSGKSSVFNGLTGLDAKTGNYPGVTVSRSVGACRTGGRSVVIEDLPGTYSMSPISPDEQVAVDVLDGRLEGADRPDALLVVVDATTLRRSLGLVAQLLARGLPACVVVTLTDELARRQGHLDLDAFARALGVPTLAVIAHRGLGITELREQLATWRDWPTAVLAPPTEPTERDAWVESVLAFADYRAPERHRITQRVDAVLLHPLWGTVVFFAVMALFFQTVFTLAAPLQGWVETLFGRLSGLVHRDLDSPWLSGLLGDAVIGGVGGVLARSLANLAVVALDRLEVLVRDRLKRLQYRPHTLDGFIAGTGLAPDNPSSP